MMVPPTAIVGKFRFNGYLFKMHAGNVN